MFQLAIKTNLQIQANSNNQRKLDPIELDPEISREIKGIVSEIFERVDTDRSGTLSLEEFKEGFAKHPDICGFFNQL